MTGNLPTIVTAIVKAARDAAANIETASTEENLTQERANALKAMSEKLYAKAKLAEADDPKAINFICDILGLGELLADYDAARNNEHLSHSKALRNHFCFLANRRQTISLGGLVGLLMFMAFAPLELSKLAPLLSKGMGAVFSGETFMYMSCALMLAWGASPFFKYIRMRLVEIYDSILFGISFLASISIITGFIYWVKGGKTDENTAVFTNIFFSLAVILVVFLIIGPYTTRLFGSVYKATTGNKLIFFGIFWAGAISLAYVA